MRELCPLIYICTLTFPGILALAVIHLYFIDRWLVCMTNVCHRFLVNSCDPFINLNACDIFSFLIVFFSFFCLFVFYSECSHFHVSLCVWAMYEMTYIFCPAILKIIFRELCIHVKDSGMNQVYSGQVKNLKMIIIMLDVIHSSQYSKCYC